MKIVQLMSVKYPLIQQYNFQCYDKAQNEFLSFDINLKDIENIKNFKPSDIKGLKGVHYWQSPYSMAKINELARGSSNNNSNGNNTGTTETNSTDTQLVVNKTETNNTKNTDSIQSSTNNSSNTNSGASNNQNSTSNANGTDSTNSNSSDSNESDTQNVSQSGTATINKSTGDCSASDVENAINLITMPDGEATVQNVQNAGQGTYIINLDLSGDSDSEDGEDCLEDAIAIVQNLNEQYPNISCYVFQGFDSSDDKVVFFDLSPSDYSDLSNLTPDQISNNPNSQYWFLYGN